MKRVIQSASDRLYEAGKGRRSHPLLAGAEKSAIHVLGLLRLFPNVYLTFTPFKIYEFRELVKDVTISKDDVVLDIGCGNGIQTLLLGERCRKVIGIDVSAKAIATAQRIAAPLRRRIHSEFRCVRTETAGFRAEEFDKIFSFCVIEHIENHEEVLQECYRILKMNGEIILSVDSLEPIQDQRLIAKHRKDHSVQRYFRQDEINALLAGLGFKQIRVYPIFCSAFARELFIRGIETVFQFGYLQSVLLYRKLYRQERLCQQRGSGIFLVVKAKK